MDHADRDEPRGSRPIRRPFNAGAVAELRDRLLGPGRFVTAVDVVEETTSTNADLLSAAATGAGEGTVLLARHQSAGRGRLDRRWIAPAGSALTFSFVVRPAVPRAAWSWLPLLTGLALRAAVAAVSDDASTVRLKWPNDLLAGTSPGKLAGILVQAGGPAAVIGIGLNVDQDRGELPGPAATSLRLLNRAVPATADLLVDVLDEWAARYRAFVRAGGDADRSGAREEYRAVCATLGQLVEVRRTGGVLRGQAIDVAADGALVVRPGGSDVPDDVAVSAGDVIHLRAPAR
ncbi:MAG: biotin--[acetyl-CoA-carboxylase] ligase [Actinomycetota bacterium]